VYDTKSFPDGLIFSAVAGFKVDLTCHYTGGISDHINFVCPSQDNSIELPCLKYIVNKRSKRSTYTYEDVSPAQMQK
jgi:hypothetical protein